MFIPIKTRNSILKMLESEVFLLKPKHKYRLSQKGECVYSVQSWKEMGLFYASMFIPIERRTLILKMVEREVSLLKPKH